MSPATKVNAKEKLHAVADKIGYPDHWRDYSKLIVVAAMPSVTRRAVEFENHRQLAKIGQPVDRGEWGMTPPTVNAYYNPSMNDINFPAGILQPPFYDPKLPTRRTTAISAASSDTSSPTASTIKAASLTPTAISTTGGRPKMARNLTR